MNRILKPFNFLFIIALVFVVAACGNSSTDTTASGEGNQTQQSEKIVMKFSHVVSPDTPKGKAIELFKEEVEKNSNGTMEVQVFPSSQLYGDADEFEALFANNVQFIAPSSTKFVQLSPSFQIFDVPFLFKNEEDVVKFWDNPNGGQAMLASLQSKDLVGLGFLSSGFKQLFDSKVPITSPEQMKGMKFRAAAGGILTEQYEVLGATNVSIPFAEVYTALQQGTIDGSENSWSNIATQKFYEVTPYITITNHGRFDYTIATNKQFWDSLTEEQKKIISDAIKKAQEYSVKLVSETEAEYMEKVKAAPNVKIIELTDEQRNAFRAAVEKMYPEWEKRIGSDLFQAALNQ
jgi:C4-dicarboxylate-binding protein DctP